jgi:Flp pilus assembly protein TadB
MSEVSEQQQRPGGRAPQTRALWWLFGGFALLVVGVLATAPELLGDVGGLGSLALVVVAAGAPGLAIVLWIAARRRASGSAEPDDTDGHPGRGA